MEILVEPTEIKIGDIVMKSIWSVFINSIRIELNHTAHIDAAFLDENSEAISNFRITMPPEVYQEWGKDDQYVIDFILSDLNLTLRSP